MSQHDSWIELTPTLNFTCLHVIFSIKFAEVECNINIQNAERIHDSKDAESNFASANETLARNEW